MSNDVIALVPRPPDVPALLAALATAGEDLLVMEAAGGGVLQLCDTVHVDGGRGGDRGDGGSKNGGDDGGDGKVLRALLTIEEPILVPVRGEVSRLLGDPVGSQVPSPVWWVEARAASTPEHAVLLAYRFADALTALLGGVVWPVPQSRAGLGESA